MDVHAWSGRKLHDSSKKFLNLLRHVKMSWKKLNES